MYRESPKGPWRPFRLAEHPGQYDAGQLLEMKEYGKVYQVMVVEVQGHKTIIVLHEKE